MNIMTLGFWGDPKRWNTAINGRGGEANSLQVIGEGVKTK